MKLRENGWVPTRSTTDSTHCRKEEIRVSHHWPQTPAPNVSSSIFRASPCSPPANAAHRLTLVSSETIVFILCVVAILNEPAVSDLQDPRR